MEVDFELVHDDEFDALCVKTPSSTSEKGCKYPAKLHVRKVAKELGVSDGLIYLPGQPSTFYEDSDQGPAFRQRRYFFYVTGVDYADCFATYDIASDHLVLWIPYVEPRQVFWFGGKPDAAQALQLYDVDDAHYSSQLPKYLHAQLRRSSAKLYVLHPEQVPRFRGPGHHHGHGHGSSSPSSSSPPSPAWGHHRVVDCTSLKPAMDRARVIKTDAEVALVRQANDVSSEAHRRVAQALARMTNERDVEAVFAAVCTARGARSQSYPIIAGAGTNGSTLHYGENDKALKGKQLMVLDAGCEWNCYASDVTRTLPITGRLTEEGAGIYGIVQQMQEECIAAMGPGAMFNRIDWHAATVALKGLLKLGILKGDAEEIAEAGTLSAFYPHGLGHHVGLDVHDVPGPRRLLMGQAVALGLGKRDLITPPEMAALARHAKTASPGPADEEFQPLLPNMIITVEPGIYFCREFIEGYFLSSSVHSKFIDADVLERYYAVGGVRIEDDILITEDGYENLTTAPKGQELFDIIKGGEKQTGDLFSAFLI